MTGKYRLSTLGCKVNQYESEQVRELLESFGLRSAQKTEKPDLAIVNTCAVTSNAAAKSRQAVRKISAQGTVPTIVIGCYATIDSAAISEIRGVVHVLGHETKVLGEIHNLLCTRFKHLCNPIDSKSGSSSYVQAMGQPADALLGAPPEHRPTAHPDGSKEREEGNTKTTTIDSITGSSEKINLKTTKPNGNFSGEEPKSLLISRFFGHSRAFLKVQDGCDAYCTYCIIPSARKRLYSKPIEDAVSEVRQLVANGYREIVLTGIFLGAYGRPTASRRRFKSNESPLAGLVEAIAQTEGLDRLRLSSLEPGDVDDALLDVLSRYENCVPHLHLPLQAGSNEVLRRMNRQYTVDEYLAMIQSVRTKLDRPAITTDVIVGFPGETDQMFEDTLNVARESGFCKIHAFPFSPRPGTAAARWKKEFVHQQAVKQRMHDLESLGYELARGYEKQFVGHTERVLVEGKSGRGLETADGGLLMHGHSDRYFEVFFAAGQVEPGEMVRVRIDAVEADRVYGTLV